MNRLKKSYIDKLKFNSFNGKLIKQNSLPPQPLSQVEAERKKMSPSIYQKLSKVQKEFIAGKGNLSSSFLSKFSENGLELSIDPYGYMTARTTDITTRMANKNTGEKVEELENTLENITKSLRLENH